jgi:hypothetical protein
MLFVISYISLVLEAWSLALAASAVPAGVLVAWSLMLAAWSFRD